jgi:TPR repeat protein
MDRTLAATLLCLILATPAWAGYNEGMDAHKRGDYATVLHELRPPAEQADADAQLQLGLMYSDGHRVPKDDAKALTWFRKAAEQGHPDAQLLVGSMYAEGLGVPVDNAKAVTWFRKAAEQGHPDAQSNLGFMYYQGHGVPRDYVQAHKWFNLAAFKGDTTALTNRDLIVKVMTPADISKAQKLAREWMEAFKKWKGE